jgi:hypothetical protein
MIYRSVLFVYLSSFLLHLQIFTAKAPGLSSGPSTLPPPLVIPDYQFFLSFFLSFPTLPVFTPTNQLPPPIRGPAMIYRSVLFVYLSSFLLHLQIYELL